MDAASTPAPRKYRPSYGLSSSSSLSDITNRKEDIILVPTPVLAKPMPVLSNGLTRARRPGSDRPPLSSQNGLVRQISRIPSTPNVHTPRLVGPLPPGGNEQAIARRTTLSTFEQFSENGLSDLPVASSSTSLATPHSIAPKGEGREAPATQHSLKLCSASVSFPNTTILPSSSTFTREVTEAMPQSYWIGRFVSLKDRFLNESLQDATDSEAESVGFVRLSCEELTLSPTLPFSVADTGKTRSPCDSIESTGVTNDVAVALKVFAHLETICTTKAATMSLRAFQQGFARKEQREILLPDGGTMLPKDSVIARASRMFGGTPGIRLRSSTSGSNWAKQTEDKQGGSAEKLTVRRRESCAGTVEKSQYLRNWE